MLLNLAMLVCILAGSSRAECPKGMNATGTIDAVPGEASKYVPHDASKVRLVIKGTAPTVDEATSNGQSIFEQVSKKLEGMSSADLRPFNFEWEENYPTGENDYEDTSAEPESFTFSQKLDIATTPGEIANVVEAAFGSGNGSVEVVNVVSYISPAKQVEEMNNIRGQAVENAMEAVKSLALGAGGEPGGIVSIGDTSYVEDIPDLEYGTGDGIEEVSVSVSLTTEFCS